VLPKVFRISVNEAAGSPAIINCVAFLWRADFRAAILRRVLTVSRSARASLLRAFAAIDGSGGGGVFGFEKRPPI
tara:strand:- start:521 stop:745 length:225 start_codon:yes stop_codon:yes gene_type:complete